MYTSKNYASKAAVKRDLAAGVRVTLTPNGLEQGVVNGTATVEGPWYPKPHSWYGRATVVDGVVVKIV